MRRQLRRFTVRRRWPIASSALALALLLAQALGVLHRVAHGPTGAGASSVAAHTHDGHTHVASLFDTHEDESSECKLYDQLTHGDALWPATGAFTQTPPNTGDVRLAACAPHTGVAHWFLARAPPARA